MKQFIQFKKQRELGEMLSDAFAFLRHEFKPFFSLILNIILPYLILFFAAFGFMLYSFGDFTDLANSGPSFLENETLSIVMLFGSIAVLTLSGIIVYALGYSATIHYIKSYTENNGVINPQQIKDEVKTTFWSFIGLSIIQGIALIVGFMLCFFPGVYLVVPMSVVFCIMIFERKSAMDAFSDSFSFVKNEWWITFLVLFVVSLIIGLAGGVVSLPATIYSWIKLGIFSGEVDPGTNALAFYKDPIYIILNVLSYAFRYFLNFITIIVTVFIYYNINEKKNFTGTFEQIDSIGNTEA